jgi:hypothetical protein
LEEKKVLNFLEKRKYYSQTEMSISYFTGHIHDALVRKLLTSYPGHRQAIEHHRAEGFSPELSAVHTLRSLFTITIERLSSERRAKIEQYLTAKDEQADNAMGPVLRMFISQMNVQRSVGRVPDDALYETLVSDIFGALNGIPAEERSRVRLEAAARTYGGAMNTQTSAPESQPLTIMRERIYDSVELLRGMGDVEIAEWLLYATMQRIVLIGEGVMRDELISDVADPIKVEAALKEIDKRIADAKAAGQENARIGLGIWKLSLWAATIPTHVVPGRRLWQQLARGQSAMPQAVEAFYKRGGDLGHLKDDVIRGSRFIPYTLLPSHLPRGGA